MPRRMLAPIVSEKHYVHTPATGVASGAVLTVTIATALAKGTAIALPSDVIEGEVIKNVYLEYWVKADNPNFTVGVCFLKRPAGVAAPSVAEMANLGSYANKKNIFEMHQGLAPSGDSVMQVFGSWHKIPKGKQRMGLGDILALRVTFTGSAGDICGFATFKAYQ